MQIEAQQNRNQKMIFLPFTDPLLAPFFGGVKLRPTRTNVVAIPVRGSCQMTQIRIGEDARWRILMAVLRC